MQNLHYLKSDEFILTKKELLESLSAAKDKEVLELSISLNSSENTDYDFDNVFKIVYEWCQSTLSNLNY